MFEKTGQRQAWVWCCCACVCLLLLFHFMRQSNQYASLSSSGAQAMSGLSSIITAVAVSVIAGTVIGVTVMQGLQYKQVKDMVDAQERAW